MIQELQKQLEENKQTLAWMEKFPNPPCGAQIMILKKQMQVWRLEDKLNQLQQEKGDKITTE